MPAKPGKSDGGKRSSGERFRPPPAEIWNNMIAAGEAFAAGRLGRPGVEGFQPRPTDLIRVKNSTGTDRERGDVVQVETTLLTDLDPENIWFQGDQPTVDIEVPYAVLLQPLPTGEIGLAQMSGVCLVKIDKVYNGHPFAHIRSGEYELTTDWYGAAELLFTQEVDSQWWAIARLSNWQSERLKAVVIDYAIAADSSGTCEVHWAGAVTSPQQTIVAHLNWMHGGNSADVGTEVYAERRRDEMKWIIVNMEC